ncbi:hypothetical protein M758_8G074900 [Ceratodon purpureus]|nr:hypothetical protein M758_8G074900 [Ceratodon purpureus]
MACTRCVCTVRWRIRRSWSVPQFGCFKTSAVILVQARSLEGTTSVHKSTDPTLQMGPLRPFLQECALYSTVVSGSQHAELNLPVMWFAPTVVGFMFESSPPDLHQTNTQFKDAPFIQYNSSC